MCFHTHHKKYIFKVRFYYLVRNNKGMLKYLSDCLL